MKYPLLILLLAGTLAGQTQTNSFNHTWCEVNSTNNYHSLKLHRKYTVDVDSVAHKLSGTIITSSLPIITWPAIQDSITAKWLRYEMWCMMDSIDSTQWRDEPTSKWKIYNNTLVKNWKYTVGTSYYRKFHQPTPAEFFRRLKEW